MVKLKPNLQGSPGPGAYDLSFKDIIKMMDQKLAIRYQISPFGSGKPRFTAKSKLIEIIPSNEHQNGFVVRDKHAASDILNEHYKNKEKYRSSYTYASNIERFENHRSKSKQNIETKANSGLGKIKANPYGLI